MRLSKYLGDKPFWQVAWKLALPIALQNVLSSSFVLVDTMMVSRLGDVTLSSVGIAGQWGWLFNLVSFGLCSGMSVFVSQYWGVRDIKGIRRVFGIALTNALLFAAIFLGVALGVPEGVIRLFNQEPMVVETGRRYLTIICYSYPAIALALIMGMLLRGTDRVTLPVFVSFCTTVINIILDYGMIFGHFGFAAMGVEGAAWASVISAWMGPVLLFAISWREKNMLIAPIKDVFRFGPKNLLAFYKKAAPVVCNESMWAVGVLTLNMIYANLGYEYYAGYTIFKTFSELCFAFYCGLCNACILMVGRSVGQGKIQRAVDDAIRFTALVPLASAVLGALTILFRYPLISIFAAGDNLSAVTLQTAVAITVICAVEGIFRNIPYVQVVGVFRSGGDTVHGVVFDLVCLFAIAIPVAWISANVLHLPFVTVVMLAYLAEDVPKAFLCLHYFRSMKWLKPVTREGREGVAAYLAQRGKG